jgi:hypothetical protein
MSQLASVNCGVCGEPYLARVSHIKKGRTKFCSFSCAGKSNAAIRTQNLPHPDILFAAKVLTRENPDDCWLWTGSLDLKGYGTVRRRGKTARAHRVAYQLWVGDIPNGLHVLHRCDLRSCCNPQHLWLGTHADNMRDMATKGRVVTRGWAGKRNQNRDLQTGRYI